MSSIKAVNNGFMLLKTTLIISLCLILLHSLIDQMISLQHILNYKKEHVKAMLAAQSGINVAMTMFEQIPYTIDHTSKSNFYLDYENGLVKQFNNTSFSLFKSDSYIYSIYKNEPFRCILIAEYNITSSNVNIQKSYIFEED